MKYLNNTKTGEFCMSKINVFVIVFVFCTIILVAPVYSQSASTFPSTFLGTWKRDNFTNTLTFTINTLKSSSQSDLWQLQNVSGNIYTLSYSTRSPTTPLTIELINGNIEISGDSGTDENNWNGVWKKVSGNITRVETESGVQANKTAEWTVRNAAGWIEAVNGIRSGGNNTTYSITITGNISVPMSEDITFGSVTGITVTIQGSGTITPSSSGALLLIGAGQTIIARDVTLKGRENNSSLVIVGEDSTFRMEGGAKVTGNSCYSNTSIYGGGVYVNGGTFTMQDSASVSGNTSMSGGGGVYVSGVKDRFNTGRFTMQGNASVTGNTAYESSGGGVYVGDGIFVMHDKASVSGNTASEGGGVYGTLTMQDNASVSGNTCSAYYTGGFNAVYRGGNGGGVYGTLTMQDNATVSNNTASSGSKYGGSGGGVYGTLTMQDNATIKNNSTNGSGGGVYSHNITMRSSAMVSGNTASEGGGVYGTITMYDNATVSGNTASNSGGGVSGTLTMQGGTVAGNTAKYTGGGVSGTLNMQGGTVSGNTASTGGGVYGTLTMQDGTVSGNTASSSNDYYLGSYGGGVYVNKDGTFTKTGGNIYGYDAESGLKNTASGRGYTIYDEKSGRWRNASIKPATNQDSYGFWLNETDGFEFPTGFQGTWKRSNFNNTLTFTMTSVKSSSRDNSWKFISISDNTYTLESNTAAKTRMTLTIKLVNGIIEISGDSGNGENNWNGTWRRQQW